MPKLWVDILTCREWKYEGCPGSKERLRIKSAHLFYCSRSLVSGVQCDVENYLTQLYVGRCHVVNAEIAVVMAVPIENPTDCEIQGVICFLQADEILGYLAEEARSRVELLFCCTTMYVRIFPGRHKSSCMSISIGAFSNILHTVRNWNGRTFSSFQKWRNSFLVNGSQMMNWRILVE